MVNMVSSFSEWRIATNFAFSGFAQESVNKLIRDAKFESEMLPVTGELYLWIRSIFSIPGSILRLDIWSTVLLKKLFLDVRKLYVCVCSFSNSLTNTCSQYVFSVVRRLTRSFGGCCVLLLSLPQDLFSVFFVMTPIRSSTFGAAPEFFDGLLPSLSSFRFGFERHSSHEINSRSSFEP